MRVSALLIVFAVTDLVHRCLLVINVLHLVLTLLSVRTAAASHCRLNAHPETFESLARNCGGRRHERRDHLHRPVRSSTCSHRAVLVSESRHLSVPAVFHSLTSVLISRFLLSLQAVDRRAVCLDSQTSSQGGEESRVNSTLVFNERVIGSLGSSVVHDTRTTEGDEDDVEVIEEKKPGRSTELGEVSQESAPSGGSERAMENFAAAVPGK
ncbi:hypothetical protein C8Q74DRAFT_652381 [Fomes fomentarius]|nr:hypothetical protein C8Q74DRAFT_652381 [Fomes fomentarius]